MGEADVSAVQTAAYQHEADLLQAYRGSGDKDALDELVRMHWGRTRGWARRYVGPNEVDDLVNDAFSDVLGAMSRGRGPSVSMGLYLATAVRYAALRRAVDRKKHLPVEDIAELVTDVVQDTPTVDDDVVQAMQTLPARWQQILWMRDVEGVTVAEAGAVLGLTKPAVSQLHRRAKSGLRAAYITVLAAQEQGEACPEYAADLVPYIQERLGEGERLRVREHVVECLRCSAVVGALRTVRPRVALMLPLPLLLLLLRRPRAAAVTATVTTVALVGGLGVAAVLAGGGDGPEDARPEAQGVEVGSVEVGTVVSVPASAGGSCSVVLHADGRLRFEVVTDSPGGCEVAYLWEGQTLLPLTEVGDGHTFFAPRSGFYDVRLVTDTEDVTTRFTTP